MASSIVAVVRKILGTETVWPEWMQSQTGYSWDGLRHCASFLMKVYVEGGNSLQEYLQSVIST